MSEEKSNPNRELKTFKDLVKEVHQTGLCGSCGGCVSFCSAGELSAIGFGEDGFPTFIDGESCLECGICYLICPQIDVLDGEIKARFDWCEPIGSFKRIVTVRSTNPEILEVCSDGGAVSAILHCLLERKMIDGAVVSKKTFHFMREPVIATTYSEILDAAGSRFSDNRGVGDLAKFSTYSPTMFAIKEIANMDLLRIAVVGTPCQTHTLRKMQSLNVVPSHVVRYVMGLFCTENFSFEADKKTDVERVIGADFEDIARMNLKEELIITLKGGETRRIPLEHMCDFVRPACLACFDFANDYADLSFGGLGSPDGWTTVVIRTEQGEAIYSEAFRHGYIEELERDREGLGEHASSAILSKVVMHAQAKRDRAKARKEKRGGI